MKPGQIRSSERWKPHSQGGRRALVRLAASTLVAALLATVAVVAEATATLGGLLEQVIMKQQVLTKAVPAEKQKNTIAAKPQDSDAKAAAKSKTAKKTVVARKAVAAKRIIVNGNPNVNPMIQQFVQQGKPMMHAELLFVRSLCKVDKPTLAKIYPETTKALDDVAKKLAEGQMQPQRAGAKNPDAGTLLQEGLAAVFKKHLPADQYTRYQAESAKRSEIRRKAAIRFMVDSIDREVLLSANQRTIITESVTKNWDESWIMYVEYLLYGNQFFPMDIDKYVTPTLNDTQKKVWQTTQKVNVGWGFGGIWMFNGQEDPIADLLGVDAKKAEPQVAPLAKVAAPAKAEAKAEKKAEKKADDKPAAKQ